MRQLIEDLISTMEYHVEQTRPIHSTTVALQAAREALKAMPTPLTCNCNQGQVCHICDPIIPPQRTWVRLTDEEIESYWNWEDFQTGAGRLTIFEMVRDIEAKLKEKNNG